MFTKKGCGVSDMNRKLTVGLMLLWVLMMGTAVYAYEETRPLHGCTIVVDAGHGGYDPGAIGVSGVEEKDLNLAIAKNLKNYLEQSGATVYMTRYEDVDLAGGATDHKKRADMNTRMKILKDSGAQLLVSIHQNSYTDSQYWGPQVFYKSGDPASEEYALAIQHQLNTYTAPECTRVVKTGESYYILKNSQVPAVLVECGFITNSKEEELLSDPEYQRKAALSIYQGIIEGIASQGLT